MKKIKLITSGLLVVCAVVFGAVILTSSSTIESSNSEVIAELSAKLTDMKEELTSLKKIDSNEAVLGSDVYIGEIILFAGNFAPRGYAFCEGQILPISENAALFSLLGTQYGGDGRSTFALPDLRKKGPIDEGKEKTNYCIAITGLYPSRN